MPARAGLTAAQTRDVYYGYDLLGRQTRARFDSINGDGVTNAFDALGRLGSTTLAMDGVSRTIGYDYDAAGNRSRITHPDLKTFDYGYDALGRLTAIRDPVSSTLITEGYSPQGPRNARGRPGGASGFQQDALGRPTSLTHYLGAPLDVQWTFASNPASQVTSVTRSNDAHAWAGHYAVARVYTTNGRNQYSAAGSASFQYDANGNLVSDGTNAYLYDVENRLVGAPGGVVSPDRADDEQVAAPPARLRTSGDIRTCSWSGR